MKVLSWFISKKAIDLYIYIFFKQDCCYLYTFKHSFVNT